MGRQTADVTKMGERRAAAGTSMEARYLAHFPAMMRVAYLLTDSAAAAEDVVHDVFLRCAPRLDTVDHPASYLRAAVVNGCRSAHRQALRARTVPGESEVTVELPHELLDTREALAALSPKKRAAVVLRYFVDIPDAEIAQILGCRPGTVRTLLHRAINDLREYLT